MFSLCLSWDIHFLLPSEISGPGFGAFKFWPGLYTSLPYSQAFEFGLNYVHHLEKEMATHSSNLAWKIPWTEEAGGPQSMLSQRVEHDWVTKQVQTAVTWRITFKFMYTLILSHACFSYFKYHKKHYFRKSWKHNEITAQKKMDISFFLS